MRFTIVTSLLAVLLLTAGCQSENTWPTSSGSDPDGAVYSQGSGGGHGCPASWRMQGLC